MKFREQALSEIATAIATVEKKLGRTHRGRGFSKEELIEAGSDFRQALELQQPVDPRKKEAERYVKTLKQLLLKR